MSMSSRNWIVRCDSYERKEYLVLNIGKITQMENILVLHTNIQISKSHLFLDTLAFSFVQRRPDVGFSKNL